MRKVPLASLVRAAAGEILLYFLHTFPLSLLYFPLIPIWLHIMRFLSARNLKVLVFFLQALYLGGLAVLFRTFLSSVPYLSFRDFAVTGISSLLATIIMTKGLGSIFARNIPSFVLASAVFALGHFLITPFPIPLVLRLALGLCLFLGTAALLAIPGEYGRSRIPGHAFLITFIYVGIFSDFACFYKFPESDRGKRIAKTPGINVILASGFHLKPTSVSLSNAGLEEVRNLREGCSPEELYVMLLREMALFKGSSREIDSPSIDANGILIDCDNKTAIAGLGLSNEVVKISLPDLSIIRSRPSCGGRAVMAMAWGADKKTFYQNWDSGGVYESDPENLECLSSIPGSFVQDLLFNKETGNLWIASGGYVRIWNPSTHIFEAAIEVKGWEFPSIFEIHFESLAQGSHGGTIYATHMNSGELTAIDPIRQMKINSANLGRGVRSIAVDETRGLLYVGNYVTGDLLIVDSKTLRTVGKIYLGERIREVLVSKFKDRIYIVSALGALSADLVPFLTGVLPEDEKRRINPAF